MYYSNWSCDELCLLLAVCLRCRVVSFRCLLLAVFLRCSTLCMMMLVTKCRRGIYCGWCQRQKNHQIKPNTT